MSLNKVAFLILSGVLAWRPVFAQSVIEDNGVGMSMEELEILVEHWPPNMQKAAANDAGDRVEILSMMLANKKLAKQFDEQTPGTNPTRYWENQFVVRNLKRKLYVENYLADLTLPDMSALAEETYLTSKEQFALVPESRKSSHILIRCSKGQCDPATLQKKRALAEQLLGELQAGADFDALAEKYSEDPGSKAKGGVFDMWLHKGMAKVEPHYVEGVFEIDGVGHYSGIVESPFGFHIIRLDAVREKSYRSFDEAKADIIAALEFEYKKLAAEEFDTRYRLTDKAFIDQKAMDKLFAKYKSADKPAQ
jgi:peptidyl-prolyl cis-trans isomerase C